MWQFQNKVGFWQSKYNQMSNVELNGHQVIALLAVNSELIQKITHLTATTNRKCGKN